jgi:hypothetical protein
VETLGTHKDGNTFELCEMLSQLERFWLVGIWRPVVGVIWCQFVRCSRMCGYVWCVIYWLYSMCVYIRGVVQCTIATTNNVVILVFTW